MVKKYTHSIFLIAGKHKMIMEKSMAGFKWETREFNKYS